MGRISKSQLGSKPLDPVAAVDLPAADDMRYFAQECRRLAGQAASSSSRRLFRDMASGWLAVAEQVERTEALVRKMRSIINAPLN